MKLALLYEKVAKTIEANLNKPIEIEASIKDINLDGKIILKMDKYELECDVRKNSTVIPFLKIGDIVIIKGWFQQHPNTIGKMFLVIEHIYPLSEKEKYFKLTKKYHKLAKILNSERGIKFRKKNISSRITTIIRKVGLIVPTNGNDEYLEKFKNMFQQKCCGHLITYYLSGGINSHSILTALEYFKKCQNIDVICLFIDNLSLDTILELSSKDIVKFLLYRKNMPYIISIMPNMKEITMTPLTAILSNHTTTNMNLCIDFIGKEQQKIKKKLEQNLHTGINMIMGRITVYRNKITKLESCINELINNKFYKNYELLLVEKIKYLLLQKTLGLRAHLRNILFCLILSIIRHPTIQKIYPALIESENKLSDDKIFTCKSSSSMSKVEGTSEQTIFLQYPFENIIPTTFTASPKIPKKLKNNMILECSSETLSILVKNHDGDF